jgi:transposase
MKMVEETVGSVPVERPMPAPGRRQHMCLDKGYASEEVRELMEAFAWTAHIPAKGAAAQGHKRRARAQARRWVVERAHSWLNRFRGILIRWSKKVENYIAMLHMSFACIILRKLGLFG